MPRTAGVLLPIFSLPGEQGIGTLGKEARLFADWLKAAGQSLWQILPLGPTGYGDSPYQPFSTFAGNPYLIDMTQFREGAMPKEKLAKYSFGDEAQSIDYGKLYTDKLAALYEAYQVENYFGLEKEQPEFTAFCRENAAWLDDYALFMAVKEAHGGAPWYEWEDALRLRESKALSDARHKLGDRVRFHLWVQYHFDKQWRSLKKYVNALGIQLIGDLPFYVALDSADVWSNPALFQMDKEGRPSAVAGVPPDAFSATGQLWGNPLYDWKRHKETNYAWWMRRVEHCFTQIDILRIDHFRGFDAYYSVPAGDETAENGHWEKGPGMEFFSCLKNALPDREIIAEDLGILTDSVRELLKETGFPGMKVLEFAFSADGQSDYLPHRWIRNCVAYTGTHDNETLSAWFDGQSKEDHAFTVDYLNLQGRKKDSYCEVMLRTALAGVADTVIIPFQDWRGLGSEARINEPSTFGKNWRWRMRADMADAALAKKMHHLTKLYGRV